MLGERQVAAPLMAQRTAHGALRPAHRRFQPGEGVGVQLGGVRLSGKPQRPSQCQFGHKPLVLGFALITPAASRPGQHCAVRRQRGRQVAPCGHASTVGQRFLRLVLQMTRSSRDPRRIPPQPHPPQRLSSFGSDGGPGLHVALSASVGGRRDRQQRRPPQQQAHGRLRLRRRLPARPLYGQVNVGAASCSATASGCGTCPNPGGGVARCRSSPLLTAPASAGS
jgi:hypothetical protein